MQRRFGRSTLPSALPQGRPLVVCSGGEIVEVEDLKGIRVMTEEDGRPRVEYLVQWKDGSPDTWEPASNLADDLLRDYEQRWWTAVRKGDEEKLAQMLQTGGPVLARTVDDDRRSALHFAAALGKAQTVKRLLDAGAEVDLADKEGEGEGRRPTPVLYAISEFCVNKRRLPTLKSPVATACIQGTPPFTWLPAISTPPPSLPCWKAGQTRSKKIARVDPHWHWWRASARRCPPATLLPWPGELLSRTC